MAQSNDYDYTYMNAPGSGGATRRESTRQRQLTALWVMLAAAALLFLSLIILILGNACSKAGGGEKDTGISADEKIQWQKVTVTAADVKTGSLVLANATHPFSIPATDPSLIKIVEVFYKNTTKAYQLAGLSTYMNAEAMTALDTMLTDCSAATGEKGLLLRYAFLTPEEEKLVTTHGTDYMTGLGVEIRLTKNNNTYDFSTNPAVNDWLAENAAKYGFVVRYPEDKGDLTGVTETYTKYFRYVGVAHATYMKQTGLCLEEYVEKLRTAEYTNKKPLVVTGADGKVYNVWCVTVNGSTVIDVPANYSYTISGTNDGTVVVTVDRSIVVTLEEEPTGGADTTAVTTPSN